MGIWRIVNRVIAILYVPSAVWMALESVKIVWPIDRFLGVMICWAFLMTAGDALIDAFKKKAAQD